ncbi:hypothetical protein BH11PSE11_BH11PSE11_11060 [soil metagenome]
MRSTRATAAVERLKRRSGNAQYSLVRTAEELFYLVLGVPPARQSEALELDAFVKFVDAFGPQTPKRVSKLDLAFESQLRKKEQ